jgi:AraC-like DNA-binding protein
MTFRQHIPRHPLTQYIAWFWYYDGLETDHSREHVLPDGSFELIINLQEQPRKLFDREDSARFESFRRGWISGAQSEYLVIDSLPGASMMGVHFRPGGAAPFLEPPADEVRDQVVELDALWGATAWELRDKLLDAPGPQAKFRILENVLLTRLLRAKSASNGKRVAWALNRFLQQPHVQNIQGVADELGVSHKHFIEEFRRRVGMTPKLFCRVRRFQEVLAEINRRGSIEWADVAFSCGYYDQAHFVNDFQAFAGLNPTTYLSHRLEYANFTRAAN